MYGYQNYGYQPNNYSTPNYNMPRSYAPQQQVMPQSQPQVPMQPQMSMDMPIQDIKYVNKAQAEAYIVFPNTKVMLIDKDSGMFYIKAADSMGQLCQNEYYRFEPINPDGTPIKPQEPIPQVNFDEFVKKSDIEGLGFVTIEQYKALAAELDTLKKQLVGGKQNVGNAKQAEGRM